MVRQKTNHPLITGNGNYTASFYCGDVLLDNFCTWTANPKHITYITAITLIVLLRTLISISYLKAEETTISRTDGKGTSPMDENGYRLLKQKPFKLFKPKG